MTKLKIQSIPDEAKNCVWEDVYKTISQEGRSKRDHLLMATADQDICLASVLIKSGEVPDNDMIEAAAAGHNAILRLYLRASKSSKMPYQVLLAAVDSGNVDNVKTLLQDGRTSVDPPNSKPSLLAVAVSKNSREIVESLLDDSRINPSGSENEALYTAAYNNNVPMMQLLIENGANPNLKRSPFVAASVGNLEAVRFLLTDPNVNLKTIPLEYLRLAESNRSPDTRPNINKNLPVKSKATFEQLAVLLNTTIYGDRIAGLFLGYYVATSKVDRAAIHTLLTGSTLTSKFLRYVTLERPTGIESVRWLDSNFYEFSIEERRGIVDAAASVQEEELDGNIPIAAFSRAIGLGWTFQEIYEEVSRKRYSTEDVIATAMLMGGYLGFDKSLESGIEPPPETILDQASDYTESTNFSILIRRSR